MNSTSNESPAHVKQKDIHLNFFGLGLTLQVLWSILWFFLCPKLSTCYNLTFPCHKSFEKIKKLKLKKKTFRKKLATFFLTLCGQKMHQINHYVKNQYIKIPIRKNLFVYSFESWSCQLLRFWISLKLYFKFF